MRNAENMQNVLSFDVEEHFQVHAFQKVIDRVEWDRYPSRVAINTRRILEMLADFDVRATFFILGWVADRHPDLVREIADGGHEIATHGYWHDLVYRQSVSEFSADLRRSLEAIQQGLGNAAAPDERLAIRGYRAPSFSITRETLWAFDVLHQHGMAYDSSIFPSVAHDRYGLSGAARFANQIDNGLWEFPVSTVPLGGGNWPVAGGGYFRLSPLCLTRQAIRHINKEGHPAVIYLHPWEFDPEQPRISDAPWLSRFRHYINLHRTESRLRALLGEFKFGPIEDVFARQLEGS
jgi:polysaccharide deacetylase family protein (PEP-CTERM system associated)